LLGLGCPPSASSVRPGQAVNGRNDPGQASPRDARSYGGRHSSAPPLALPAFRAGDARFSHNGPWPPYPLRARWLLILEFPAPLADATGGSFSRHFARSDRARRCDPGRQVALTNQQSAGSATGKANKPGLVLRATSPEQLAGHHLDRRPPGAGCHDREHEKAPPLSWHESWDQPHPKPASALLDLIPAEAQRRAERRVRQARKQWLGSNFRPIRRRAQAARSSRALDSPGRRKAMGVSHKATQAWSARHWPSLGRSCLRAMACITPTSQTAPAPVCGDR